MVDKAYVEDEIIGQKKKSKNKSTKKSIKRVLKSNKTSIFAWNGKCLTPDCNGEGNTMPGRFFHRKLKFCPNAKENFQQVSNTDQNNVFLLKIVKKIKHQQNNLCIYQLIKSFIYFKSLFFFI